MNPSLPPPPPLTLSELTATVAGAWRTVVAGAAAGTVLGVTAAVVAAPGFEAVATVRVDPVEVAGATTHPSAPLDMTAEASVARSRAVAAGASDLLDGTGADVVERAVTVRAVEGSSVLEVAYSGPTAGSAAAGANAVAHAYLAARSLDAMSRADRLRERVVGELGAADGHVRRELESVLAQVDLADLRGGELIDPARAPRSATGPGPVLSGVAGALLGALVAVPFAARRCLSRAGVSRSRGAPAS